MKIFVIILSLSFSFTAFGQTYPDSGFTNKAEAKNIMVNGKKVGKWIEYMNGIQGQVIEDTEDAQFYRLTVYKSDNPLGIVRVYTKTGYLVLIKPYKNGKENGIEKEYYYNHSLGKDIPVTFDSISNRVAVNGSLKFKITYIDGKENGVAKGYYRNGKIRTIWFMNNGVATGTWKLYYENGNLQSESYYINGQEAGIIKYYYEDGQIQEDRPVLMGYDKGVDKKYYNNGHISSEHFESSHEYPSGDSHTTDDSIKEYYENGVLKSDENYYPKDTSKEHNIGSVLKTYYNSGALQSVFIERFISESSFEGFTEIEEMDYDENGNLKSEYKRRGSSWHEQ